MDKKEVKTKVNKEDLCDNCGKYPCTLKDYRTYENGNADTVYSCGYCASLNDMWHYKVRKQGLDPKKVLDAE